MYKSDFQPLLKAVNETSFALDEAVLFLDTHGSCPEAMAYYQEMREKHYAARAAFERACGPLTNRGVEGNQYTWVEDPWPWELGGNY